MQWYLTRAPAGPRCRGWFAALAAALLAWALPSGALGHPFPTPFELLATPTDASARAVVALRPGFALSDDAGEHWDFVCGAVADLAGDEAFPVVLTGSGRLLVAAYASLVRDDGQGCGFERLAPGGLPGSRLTALRLRGDGSIEALSAVGASGNGLYVSHDEGESWERHGAPLPDGALPAGYLRAPSDPARIYMVGRVDGGAPAVLWVSPDDGASWQQKPLDGELPAQLLAVDPTDPARLWIRRVAAASARASDALLVSADGGDGFEELARVRDLGGFAVSSDGRTLWYGSQSGGLSRLVTGEAPETLDGNLRVGCLEHRDGRLWVCGHDQPGLDPFAVAFSEDGGERWTPLLRSAQVRRLRTCGNPEQASECASEWSAWKSDVFGSGEVPPLPDAGAPDAGPPDASTFDAGPSDAGAPGTGGDAAGAFDAGPPADAAGGSPMDAASADVTVPARPAAPGQASSGCSVSPMRSPGVTALVAALSLVAWLGRRRQRGEL